MNEKIIILDFGSQYTQLIARRVRELNVYCEIHPFNKKVELDDSVKGVVLSGSPFSVLQENAPQVDLQRYIGNKPLLCVCSWPTQQLKVLFLSLFRSAIKGFSS